MKTDTGANGVLVAYSVSMLSSAMPAALFYFYVRDVLGAEDHITSFLALYLVPGLITLPLWHKAAQVFGPARAWFFAMLFTVMAFVGVCFLGKGDVIPYGIICVLSGLTFGAEFFLPARVLKTVLPHTTTEGKKTAVSYAAVTLVGKLMAVMGCAPLLLFTGPFTLPQEAQPAALIGFYGLLPCLLKVYAAYLLRFWLKTKEGKNEKPFNRGDAHAA